MAKKTKNRDDGNLMKDESHDKATEDDRSSKASSTNAVRLDIWKNEILSNLRSSDNNRLPVKKLRRLVFHSLLQDNGEEEGGGEDSRDVDKEKSQKRKTAKKSFKKAVQAMETDGTISLNAEGIVALLNNDKDTKEKKKKKRAKEEGDHDDNGEGIDKKRSRTTTTTNVVKHADENQKTQHDNNSHDDDSDVDDGEKPEDQSTSKASTPKAKNAPCPGNPQGITRLFLGNLPFAIDEPGLNEFFASSSADGDNNKGNLITHIQWITDKATGKFYGSAFVEMENSALAAHAVTNMAGTSCMGRPIKINFAPARPGDVWPPPTKVVTGTGDKNAKTNEGSRAGGGGSHETMKPMSAKPDGCVKLFIGNLSYEIDDDKLKSFFASVDAEVKAVRWLHHKESGDFKGCGFVEFWNTEACEKAATLNGKNLLGRKIRIDWSD